MEEDNLAYEPPQGSRVSIWTSSLPLCLPGGSRKQSLLYTGPRQKWTEIRAFQAKEGKKSNIMFVKIGAKNIFKKKQGIKTKFKAVTFSEAK